MTPEQRKILSLANTKGKFALQVGYNEGQDWENALEAMQLNGTIRLIDVSPIAESPGLFRIFLVDFTKVDRE